MISTDEDVTGGEHLALKDMTLSISPREKVAICGRSGSGKSSLILLLLRLLDPTSTSPALITIDSLPLTRIPRRLLRTLILAIPQDPVFLPGSNSFFLSNLDPLRLSSPEEAQSVLETVSLWPFVSSRGGLNAPMTGDTLSQGQKQLFSLARAILRRRLRAKERQAVFGTGAEDGGILLLDEVSSSVDKDTDEQMQRIIMDEFRDYTIVMVSHRLGMVMGFDTVVVMEEGRIVETGKPTELVEMEGSRFKDLWTIGKNGKS